MNSLFSGAFAGLTVDLILYPLDTIKSRVQAQRTHPTSIRQAYKGIGAVLVQSVPSSAVFFMCFDSLRLQLGVVPAAIIAESMASAVRVPMEVVKQQLQCNSGSQSIQGVVKHALKYKGWSGLVVGWRGMLARDVPFSLLQYPLYIILKTQYENVSPRNEPHWYTDAMSGAVAGSFAAGVTHPLDVCKTRAMVCGEADRPWLLLHDLFNRGLIFSGLKQRVMLMGGGGFIYFGAFSIGQHIYDKVFGRSSSSSSTTTSVLLVTPATTDHHHTTSSVII